jgi:hypothetical protein
MPTEPAPPISAAPKSRPKKRLSAVAQMRLFKDTEHGWEYHNDPNGWERQDAAGRSSTGT